MATLTVVDAASLASVGAGRVAAVVERSIEAHGSAMVSLTGGRTVQGVYEWLAHGHDRRIDWSRVHLFWGDERHVSPDDPQSNFGMAHRALLAHVRVPDAQIHRMQGELPDAVDAARAYHSRLREAFALTGRADQTFDLSLVSLGHDAHIASIFPGSPLLEGGNDARVAAIWASHLNAWRITLTPAALVDAHAILVLASGSMKAEAVRAALELPEDLARWPGQLLRTAGERVEWVVDREAASQLSAVR